MTVSILNNMNVMKVMNDKSNAELLKSLEYYLTQKRKSLSIKDENKLSLIIQFLNIRKLSDDESVVFDKIKKIIQSEYSDKLQCDSHNSAEVAGIPLSYLLTKNEVLDNSKNDDTLLHVYG